MTAAGRMSSAIPDDIHGVAAPIHLPNTSLCSHTLRLNVSPKDTSCEKQDWVTPSKGRRDQAAGECRGDRLHRRGDVGSALDRRQSELDSTFAAGRQGALDSQPQRRRVADQRRFDRFAGQGPGLAREQCRSSDGRLVATADTAAEGIARRPFSNGRPRTRPGAFGALPSVIAISSVQRAGQSRNRSWPGVYMQCQLGNF